MNKVNNRQQKVAETQKVLLWTAALSSITLLIRTVSFFAELFRLRF
ncbi:hypothetical protein [Eupransor demetentiae]|uniref:Uncharacterized protein n=1 Tax=Eupransor demetentiae TaxID=3109584 RepID=A0ABP0EQM9_9LACO|nr:hypothetical protein R54876_GBNLAHCA_01045 [Lactobacillaceae bacterium LMG 33000]